MSSQNQLSEKLTKLTTTKLERKGLDTSFHFISVNLDVLDITLGSVIVQNVDQVYDADTIAYAKEHNIDLTTDSIISLTELKNKITSFIKSKHSNSIFIRNNGDIFANGKKIGLTEINNHLPATVTRSDGGVVGALYSSYNSAYDGLFRSFLNTEISKFINKSIYKDTNYKVGFDVGHIFGNTNLAKTPLGEKLKKLFSALSAITENLTFDDIDSSYIQDNKTSITKVKQQVESALDKLASNSTYGTQVETIIDKDFALKSFLLSVNANIVIIQDRFENQALYAKLVEGPLGKEIADLLKKMHHSRSLLEEINYRITSAFKQEQVAGSKSSQKLPKIGNFSKLKIALGTKSNKKQVSKIVPIKGSYYSLANLQTLLDAQLVQRVKENMGSGNRRDILNLRTGRFAESVKVERVSESRAGMITAFYTYMQNPYGTFSAGGQQERPKSRDPKLLIGKSIREIAKEKVKNRLRAVLV